MATAGSVAGSSLLQGTAADRRLAAAPTGGVVHVTDAYFSLKRLSAYSGLSVRRLRAYLTDRVHPLPSYRIGGKILVRRSDYDAWAAQFRRDGDNVDALVDEILQGL
jgi:hypothetical protein